MKIIGQTAEGFLLSATEDEVYNLVGYYSRYSDGAKKLKPGDEINIGAMFMQLYRLRDYEKQVHELRMKLQNAIDCLTMAEPVAREIFAEPQPENQG